MKYFLTIVLFFLPFATLEASPLYPWDHYYCSSIKQNDGKKIGAICAVHDSELGVMKLSVYYYGYLFENESEYSNYYANFSINGSAHYRRPLKKTNYGDGSNLPVRAVYHASFIATHHFQNLRDYPAGQPYSIYFQAEQRTPRTNPPFSYDNQFGQNYSGTLPTRY